MKSLLIMLALLFSFGLYGQAQEPLYEREDDMIKVTYYHDNGQIAQTGFFLDEKLHGEWRMFDDEGNKLAIGNYDMGKKTGKWFFWDKKGLKEVNFVDNQIVNVMEMENSEPVTVF